MDQIELDGQWSLSSETSKCHFSYLLSSKQKVIPIHIDPKDLGVKDPNSNSNDTNNQEKNDINSNINKNAESSPKSENVSFNFTNILS